MITPGFIISLLLGILFCYFAYNDYKVLQGEQKRDTSSAFSKLLSIFDVEVYYNKIKIGFDVLIAILFLSHALNEYNTNKNR